MPTARDTVISSTRSLLLGPNLGTIDTVPFGSTWVHASYTHDQALFLHSFHPLYLDAARPAGCFAFFGTRHAPETQVFFFYVSWRHGADNMAGE